MACFVWVFGIWIPEFLDLRLLSQHSVSLSLAFLLHPESLGLLKNPHPTLFVLLFLSFLPQSFYPSSSPTDTTITIKDSRFVSLSLAHWRSESTQSPRSLPIHSREHPYFPFFPGRSSAILPITTFSISSNTHIESTKLRCYIPRPAPNRYYRSNNTVQSSFEYTIRNKSIYQRRSLRHKSIEGDLGN
jgi:hypothetical protein